MKEPCKFTEEEASRVLSYANQRIPEIPYQSAAMSDVLDKIEQIISSREDVERPKLTAPVRDVIKAILMGNVAPSEVGRISNELMRVFESASEGVERGEVEGDIVSRLWAVHTGQEGTAAIPWNDALAICRSIQSELTSLRSSLSEKEARIKELEAQIKYKPVLCDGCGKEPTTIIYTDQGKFCKQCQPK